MLNVGRVAQCMAAADPGLLSRFSLGATTIGALAALHDLGKISPGFQRKCPAWLAERGLQELDRNCGWNSQMEPNHARVTHAAVQSALVGLGTGAKAAACFGAVLGAHHGRVQARPDSRPFRPNGITESRSGLDWEQERALAAKEILNAFGTSAAGLDLHETDPSLWWLAGLTSVADWIGSDVAFFAPDGGMEDAQRLARAGEAVRALGFDPPQVRPGLTFAELFELPEGATANDMQTRARGLIAGPGVYVIEAPMGMGKTEAALWVAYELLASRKARGIYFALPTQATSNRIHLRMNAFVNRMAPQSVVRLIHGQSWLGRVQAEMEPAGTVQGDREDARAGGDWFASGKRALLAPFGVGTIDQALLGIVAAKHFFVRQFALAGKVVILDEVHSYDLYTGTLIDRLVDALKGLGCTIIILSATLTDRRRNQLLPELEEATPEAGTSPYPSISAAPEAGPPVCIACAAPPAKRVSVGFERPGAAQAMALDAARKGRVVLWICNSVQSAQGQYAELLQASAGAFPVGLLHSRFPFWRRQILEDEWMARLGREGQGRCGCILVSTQIVEQSVDLDADILFTELAPTDMLFQRMGRLWRHERPGRAGNPSFIILEESATLDALRRMEPKAIVQALGAKAYVYSPYVLLRSLEVWGARAEVILPDQIRPLIEATYADRETMTEPTGWQDLMDPASWGKLLDERYGQDLGRKFLAARNTQLWQTVLEDVEGTQTRLNEVPTVQLVMCHSLEGATAEFLDQPGPVRIDPDRFQLTASTAIHRNLVKVPRHVFARVIPCAAFEACLFGEQTVGRVAAGQIQVEGLKPGVSLRWSNTEGVVIQRDPIRSQS